MDSVITVKQLNTYLKSILDGDRILKNIFIEGEISNFKHHYPSGHFYFTLKDDSSAMRCVMFKTSASRLNFEPEDGMNLVIKGSVSLFERDGSVQIYVTDMIKSGQGKLNIEYEKMLVKLEAEGLFDKSHKKEIPEIPEKIGVITSKTGAVIEDILNTIKRRYNSVEVIFIPVNVQGEYAKNEIVNAIEQMNKFDDIDTLIIGRGGGSIEDLWAFNEEEVARAIFKSKIPIISAVGHETDFTISDYVSDMRAPTPTAAAELATPDKMSIIQEFDYFHSNIKSNLDRKLVLYKRDLNYAERVTKFTPLKDNISLTKEKLSKFKNVITILEMQKIASLKNEVMKYSSFLDSNSPHKILEKGYTYVMKENEYINNLKELSKDDEIDIVFSDGTVKAKVIDIS